MANVDYTFDIDNGLRVQDSDLDATEYFAVAILGLMFPYVVWKAFRCLYFRSGSKSSAIIKGPAAVSRFFQRLLVQKVKGFTSAGHVMVITIYVIINAVLLFTNIDWSLPSNIARRCGWLATANIAFLFFLALKNTPLGILTSWTYERLNVLHQVAGYTTVLLSVLHTILFIHARGQENIMYNLVSNLQIPGIIATIAMLAIAITSLTLRKRHYELFYILHLILAILILAAVYHHRPNISTRTCVIIIFSAGIFLLDRSIRGARFVYFSRNTLATMTPLANGGTRVVLNRSLPLAKPGMHASLWINKIKKGQAHPFTIVSVDPVPEFVISAQNGFTKSLHAFALENPGKSLGATVDGPYGTVPNFERYDRIVLIAGGSGGSWTIAVANEIVRRGLKPGALIDFVWVVRDNDTLTWFSTELSSLRALPYVNLILHTTNSLPQTSEPRKNPLPEHDIEMAAIHPTLSHSPSSSPLAIKEEAQVPTGRPNVATKILDVVCTASPDQHICVGACGPAGMVKDVRSGVSRSLSQSKGVGVDLHIEEFSW